MVQPKRLDQEEDDGGASFFAVVVVPDGLSFSAVKPSKTRRDSRNTIYSRLDGSSVSSDSENDAWDSDSESSSASPSGKDNNNNNNHHHHKVPGTRRCTENEPLCCLRLPLGNSLLLSNLELLRRSGISRRFVLARQEIASNVSSHIASYSAKKSHQRGVTVVPLYHAKTELEALRELAAGKHSVDLRSNFLMVVADTMVFGGTLHVRELMDVHSLEINKKASNRLFTRFVAERPACPDSGWTRDAFCADRAVLAVGDTDGEIVAFSSEARMSHIVIDGEMLKPAQRNALVVISRSMESGIDAFSPKIFEFLEDHFDCLHIRPDLLTSILADELHLHSVGAYLPVFKQATVPPAARISSLELAFLACRALMHLELDAEMEKFWPNASALRKDHIKNATLDKSIVDITTLCGPGVVFRNSLVFPSVIVGENTTCEHCVLHHGVTVPAHLQLKNVTVKKLRDGSDECAPLPSTMERVLLRVAAASEGVLPPTGLQGHGVVTEERSAGLRIDSLFHRNVEPETPDCTSLTIREFLDEEGDSSTFNSDSDSEAPERRQTRKSLLNPEAKGDERPTADASSTDEAEEDEFFDEVYCLAVQGLKRPAVMSHKLLEIRSFRLASNRRLVECLEPCVKAAVALFPQTSQITEEMIHVAGISPLLEAFVSHDAATQWALLDALLKYSKRQLRASDFDSDADASSDSDSDKSDDASEDKSDENHGRPAMSERKGDLSETWKSPLSEPETFARFTGVLLDLDIISDGSIVKQWLERGGVAQTPQGRALAALLSS